MVAVEEENIQNLYFLDVLDGHFLHLSTMRVVVYFLNQESGQDHIRTQKYVIS